MLSSHRVRIAPGLTEQPADPVPPALRFAARGLRQQGKAFFHPFPALAASARDARLGAVLG